MQWLFLGIVAIGLLLVAINAFMGANPRDLARTLRQGAGYSALAIALIFTFLGRIGFAVPLAALGFMLLRGGAPFGGGFPGSRRPSPGQRSRVRTPTLEMTLDHDTGAMDGGILTGKYSGRRLTALGLDELLELRGECQAGDLKALPLIEAFLDRNHQGWRGDAGSDSGRGGAHLTSGGPMTRDEAYEILGLEAGASSDLIRRAHRQLMKKLHPDQGGSNYLAAKVNEAKDLLLSN